MLLGPSLPGTHLNYCVAHIPRLYSCSILVLGGSTHYLELYWLWKPCLDKSWWFSPFHVVLLGPSLQRPTKISLSRIYKSYICVPHWCWVVAPISWNFIGCENLVSGLVMVVVTLSRHATWPFPPGTHLNFYVMHIPRLYLCSTLVLGCSTHFLELYWLWKHVSGPLMVVLTLSHCATWPFPPGTHLNFFNFSVTNIPRLYLCSTLVLVGSTHYLELYCLWKPCVWTGHGGCHPVTSCYLALPLSIYPIWD